MVVKIALEFTYFIAEGCFKNEIIESNSSNRNRWYFKTKEHTFIFDREEQPEYTTGYDVVELNVLRFTNFPDSKINLKYFLDGFDSSKKYFVFWYYGEAMHSNNNVWEKLMDIGVNVYSSTWIKEYTTHPNYIYNMDFAFHYFNYFNGICYINKDNLTKNSFKKNHKVGLYGVTSSKLENEDRHWRNKYINYFASKTDAVLLSYDTKGLFQLSQLYRNQHLALSFDFADCNYFITAETHFNQRGTDPDEPHFADLPYFTSEKILKGAIMEFFDTNTILITSPMHMKDLHDRGFWFSNSKFIKEYTPEAILNSLFECYESDEIIPSNNLELIKDILNTNLFTHYNIL